MEKMSYPCLAVHFQRSSPYDVYQSVVIQALRVDSFDTMEYFLRHVNCIIRDSK